MKLRFALLLCSNLFFLSLSFAQNITVPNGYEGPIFFDSKNQSLKNQLGASIYRIFRLIAEEEINPSNALGSNNQTAAVDRIVERNRYYYFEDHFLTGELQFQGHMMITRLHNEQGANLFAFKVHLKGECRWFHKNGQLAQLGVYNGEDKYGVQKFYNEAGKLTQEQAGKGLGQYLYSFERNTLKRKGFKYQEGQQSDILPSPSGTAPLETQSSAVLDSAALKPIDIQAKIASMPHFSIKNYKAYQGVYQGQTVNRALKKNAETSFALSEIDPKAGTAILEVQWFGGFTGYVKLNANLNENVVLARGDFFNRGAKTGTVILVAFLPKEGAKLEGFFNFKPLEEKGEVQSCSFELKK